jgi:CRISPR system Cascade subunit CasA
MKSSTSHKIGVLACGYALDQMKPLDFTEAFLPIITTGSDDGDRELAACAAQMIAAANYAAALLSQMLNAALFAGNGKSDNSLLNSARARFWSDTEDRFYALLREAAQNATPEGLPDVRPQWLEIVRSSTLRIFDDMAPLDEPESLDIKDLVEARTLLLRSLHGKKFYSEAGLPPPENNKTKRRAA